LQATRSDTFTTAEGRPFTVVWTDPENARYLWRWNQDHHPNPMSPLEEWIWRDPPGRLRAYAEAAIDAPGPFRGFEVHHGYQFIRADAVPIDAPEQFIAKSRALSARFGGACNVWPRYSLPRIERAYERLRAASVEAATRDLSETFNYAFHLTHVAGMGVLAPLNATLMRLLAPAVGWDEAALLGQEIGQGGDNATVASDRAIARLAQLAATNPQLHAAVRNGEPASRGEVTGGDAFFDEFDQFLATYGDRAQTWGIDHPTMREDPAFVWGMIRAAIQTADSPDERRRAARTREVALQRINDVLRGTPEQLRQALEVAEELRDYVTVREGRAFWQLTAGGILRTRLLEKGAVLVERGAISIPDDIRYLLPDEIDPLFEQGGFVDLRSLVADRRSVHEAQALVTPPRFITGNPALVPGAGPTMENVLRGAAGARGRVTAQARVVLTLDDADGFEPGEVLVCAMTTPAWTPLFGLASAVVTDSGMALSHPAIAAREYGIPCVVGTADATSRIRTGDTIAVDGDAGTVRIQARPGLT